MSGADIQEFPSDFPIKVMGRHDSNLRRLQFTGIIDAMRARSSKRACERATAATATSCVEPFHGSRSSRKQLDDIYREPDGLASPLLMARCERPLHSDRALARPQT